MKKINRLLSFLLAFTVVITTFSSDYTAAHVYATQTETLENADDTIKTADWESVDDEDAATNASTEETEGENTEEPKDESSDVINEDDDADSSNKNSTETTNDDASQVENKENADKDGDVAATDNENVAATEATTSEAVAATTEESEEEEKKVTFDAVVQDSVVVNGIKISLYAEKGILPNDAVLEVKTLDQAEDVNVTEEDVEAAIDEEVDAEIRSTIAFDINIYSESIGDYVQPEDQQNVSITFEAVNSEIASEIKADDTDISVYHVAEDGGDIKYVEKLDNASVEGASVSVETGHFSIYVLNITLIYGNEYYVSSAQKFTVGFVDEETGEVFDVRDTVPESDTIGNDKIYPGDLANDLNYYNIRYHGQNYEFVCARDGGDKAKDHVITDFYLEKSNEYYNLYNVAYHYTYNGTIAKQSMGGTGSIVYFYYKKVKPESERDTLVIAIRDDGKVPAEPSINNDHYEYIGVGGSTGTEVTLTDYFTPTTPEVEGRSLGYEVKAITGPKSVNERLTDNFRSHVEILNAGNKYWNSETQYVEWYVIKYQGNDEKWHIDGVIKDKSKVKLNYEKNIPTGARANDGLIPDGDDYVKGTWVTVEGLPSVRPLIVEGYAFAGWNTQADGKGQDWKKGQEIQMNDNVTLYAKWNPVQKKSTTKVKYVYQQADGIYPDIKKVQAQNRSGQVIVGETESITAEDTKVKDGLTYTFDSQNTGNVTEITVKENASENVFVLYYKRPTVGYTVQFYYQNSLGKYDDQPTSQDTSRVGIVGGNVSVIEADETPIKKGYTFDADNKSNKLEITKLDKDSTKNVLKVYFKKDKTGKTAYFYVLIPSENNNVPKDSSGQNVKKFFPLNPYHDCEGVGTDPSKIPTAEKDKLGNVYDVTGVNVKKHIIEMPEDKLNEYLKKNYPEAGFTANNIVWYTYKNANDKDADGNAAWHFDGYVKGDAVTVTYNLNSKPGDTVIYEDKNLESGNKYTVKSYDAIKALKTEFDNPGYVFKGWNTLPDPTDEKHGEVYNVGEEFTLKSNVVLYAQWEKKDLHVTYEFLTDADRSMAAAPTDDEIHHVGDSVIVKDAPVVPGYDFKGWFIKTQDLNPDTATSVTTLSMPGEDVVLVGTYKASTGTKYTVEHYTQNLTGAEEGDWHLEKTESLSGTTGATVTYGTGTEGAHYKDTAIEGFTFTGEDNVKFVKRVTGQEDATVNDHSILPAGNLVIKLYYKRNSYLVEYSYEGELVPENVDPSVEDLGTRENPSNKYTRQYLFGENVVIADDATAPKYTFSGWNAETVTVTDGSFTMPARDVAVKGSFERDKKNLVIKLDIAETGSNKDERVYNATEQKLYVKLKGDISKKVVAEAGQEDAIPVVGPAVRLFKNAATAIGRWLTVVSDAAEDVDPNSPIETTYEGEIYRIYGVNVTPAAGTDVGTYYAEANINPENIHITRVEDGKEVSVDDEFEITSDVKEATKIGELKIVPAHVTVTATTSATSKVAGSADPIFSANVVVDDERIMDFDSTIRANLQKDAEANVPHAVEREKGETAGKYAVKVNGIANRTEKDVEIGNFSITYIPTEFTITAAPAPTPTPTPSTDDDSTPDAPGTVEEAPVFTTLAATPAVLGATRGVPVATGDAPAVLGARRAGTDDTNILGSIITIIVAAAIAFSMVFIKRKKKEEN